MLLALLIFVTESFLAIRYVWLQQCFQQIQVSACLQTVQTLNVAYMNPARAKTQQTVREVIILFVLSSQSSYLLRLILNIKSIPVVVSVLDFVFPSPILLLKSFPLTLVVPLVRSNSAIPS